MEAPVVVGRGVVEAEHALDQARVVGELVEGLVEGVGERRVARPPPVDVDAVAAKEAVVVRAVALEREHVALVAVERPVGRKIAPELAGGCRRRHGAGGGLRAARRAAAVERQPQPDAAICPHRRQRVAPQDVVTHHEHGRVRRRCAAVGRLEPA
eukprot:6818097-Prymnesium_polylepis.1